MSDTGGLSHLPQLGNAQHGLTALFDAEPETPLYWSVQALDTAFAGSPFSADGSFKLQSALLPVRATNAIPGDTDGDGLVSQSEFAAVLEYLNGNGVVSDDDLDLVLSNYWPYSPWIEITNVAGLGGSNVLFSLPNAVMEIFTVEYSTNLFDWLPLGPATSRYESTDTNAPPGPQRHYRLRWP